MNFDDILNNGTTISSSGTTGTPKQVYRSPSNLKACIDVAVSAQQLTQRSRVLTVTRMTHAGGLLTQTLPAYSIGADFKIQQFNAFTFLKDFADYTHTFLTPAHMTALMKTKGFKDCNLSGKWILGGSDPVSWEMIEAFVSKGAVVQPNWGMSEVGPMAINKTYTTQDVEAYDLPGYTIMGDTAFCDIQISEWNELMVKGDICVYDDWFATGDIIKFEKGSYWYHGRK